MAEEANNAKIVYVVAAPPTNLKCVYASAPVYALAGIQIFSAVITLILGIFTHMALVLETTCSIFFALSGVFSLAGARTGNRCLIITTMVFSIISAFCGIYTCWWEVSHIIRETGQCADISAKYGDYKMNKPYFMNVNETRGSEYDASDEALCDPTKPETGAEWDKINDTFINSSHPCFTGTCSSLHLTLLSLLMVTSIIALVAAIATGAFTCRATCCYTPPKGVTPAELVVFNKEEDDEAELGKYREMKT